MTQENGVTELVKRLRDKNRGWHPDQEIAALMLESLQRELTEANRKLAEWQDGTLRHQDHQAEIRLQMDAAKAARGALRGLEIDLTDANRKLEECLAIAQECLAIAQEFAEDKSPTYKPYEDTYLDGWLDAANEIALAIAAKIERKGKP